MKRNQLILIAVIIILPALIIPGIMKNKLSDGDDIENISENKSGYEHYERLENPPVVPDTAIVNIKDIEGAEVNLYTFNSACLEMYDGLLDYEGERLSGIFEEQKVLPIQKLSGIIGMYYIEEIDEYYFDGKNVSILLRNGEIVKGYPVKDYLISGLSLYGEISIPMDNIHFAKFNQTIPNKVIKDSKENLKQYFHSEYGTSYEYKEWPNDFHDEIRVTTISNHSELINAPIFIYHLSGCDDSWIPCKSYTVWGLADFIPVKNGTFNIEINIKDINTLELSSSEKEDEIEYFMNLTLKNGERMTNALLFNGHGSFEEEYSTSIGILGTMEYGISFLSINNIKKLTSE